MSPTIGRVIDQIHWAVGLENCSASWAIKCPRGVKDDIFTNIDYQVEQGGESSLSGVIPVEDAKIQ